MVLDVMWIFDKKILCTLLFCMVSGKTLAKSEPNCEEFPITMKVEHIGETEMPALICGKNLFLSIKELFGFLKIKVSGDSQNTTFEGYIWGMEDTYRIDLGNRSIQYQGNIGELTDTDFKKTDSGVFLSQQILHRIFGLNSTFNFRNLSALLKTESPLPYIKTLFREKLRNNLNNHPKHLVADTTLVQTNSKFVLGTASWDIFSSQRSDGLHYNRFGLGLGGGFMGGDFNAKLNLLGNEPFNWQNQFYRWQLVNNQNTKIRQLVLGKISARPKASIFSPIIGMHITNRPTYQKNEFGTQTVSDFTGPNWMVELYVNNVLVDYTKADKTGFYQFEIPLGYGNTNIDIRCFGPFGEEERLSKQLTIPLRFQPKGSIEYDMMAGVVEETGAFFFHSGFNYGLSPKITLGGGLEYLSTLEKNRILPFVEGNMRIGPNTMLSGTYLHNVGYQSNLLYKHPKNHQLDLSYTKYKADQHTVLYTYEEQRLAVLTTPMETRNLNLTSRLAWRHTIYKHNALHNMDWLLSTSLLGFNANLHTRAFFNEWVHSDYLTQFRLSKAVMPKVFLTSQLEYSFKERNFNSIKTEISKSIFKDTYLRASIEQNFKYDRFYVNFGINIGMGFSRLGLTSSSGNNQSTFSQHLMGSMSHIAGENSLVFEEIGSLGRASMLFEPFLDVNGNGKKESGETNIKGLEVYSAGGGKKQYLESGSIIFTGMEPYVEQYFSLELDPLQNIAWTLDLTSVSLIVSPNQVKRIRIPIKVVGEVMGLVKSDGKGIGGLKMELKTNSGEKMAELVSEDDGSFGHFGLPNGEYLIQFDSIQLMALGLQSEDTPRFTIHNGRKGSYVDDLLIHLGKSNANMVENLPVAPLEKLGLYSDNEVTNVKDLPAKRHVEASKAPKKASHAKKDNVALARRTNENLDSLNVSDEFEGLLDETGTALNLPGLTYGIQLFATRKKLSPSNPILDAYPNMTAYELKGGYGYLFAGVTRYDEAMKLASMARKNGIHDPVVVPLYKGRTLSPEEFKMLLRLHGQVMSLPDETTKDSLDLLEFKVQITKSKEKLPVNAPQFGLLPELFEYYDGHDYKYFLQKSLGLKNAIQVKETLVANGFGNATIVPFDTTGILNPLQVYGRVRYQEGNHFIGVAGVSISIHNDLDEKITVYLSDADGTFKIKGLPAGNYKAIIDTDRLETFTIKEKQFAFSIQESGKGFLITKDFVLSPSHPKTHTMERAGDGSKDDLVFKVQILATNKRISINHKLFNNLGKVQSYYHQGLHKYSVGNFELLEEARALKLELQEKGFKDAFIVCFYKGRRLNMLELTGRVFIRSEDVKVGMEGIKIHIYDRETNGLITTVVSEHEGYFHFLGLKPGSYRIELSTEQLQNLELKPSKLSKDFEIRWDNPSASQLLSIDLSLNPQ